MRVKRLPFTLVEMMMVIVIIGILAGLIGVAASKAVTAARRTAIPNELTRLNGEIEKTQTDIAAAPPAG